MDDELLRVIEELKALVVAGARRGWAAKFNEGRLAPGMRASTGAYIGSAITLPVIRSGLRIRSLRDLY